MATKQDKIYRAQLKKRWHDSGLTQSEFARTLPDNPRTKRPFSVDHIQRVLSGKTSPEQIRQVETYDPAVFVQRISQGDKVFSFRLQKPAGMSVNELLTTDQGELLRRKTIRKAMARRLRLRGTGRELNRPPTGIESIDYLDPDEDFILEDTFPALKRRKTRAETYVIEYEERKVDKRTGEILE